MRILYLSHHIHRLPLILAATDACLVHLTARTLAIVRALVLARAP